MAATDPSRTDAQKNYYPAYVHVYSLGFTALRGDKKTLSLSGSETLTLSLDAAPLHKNQLYLLPGSLSTLREYDLGLALGPVTLPPALDAWSWLTLAHPNNPAYPGSLGFLDGQGRKVTGFRLIPGLPKSLAGLEIRHAFVVLDWKKNRVAFASNPGPVKVQQ